MDTKSGNPKSRMKVVMTCALIGCLVLAACIPSFLKYREQRRLINAITPEQVYQVARSGDVSRLKWILERRPDLIDAPGNTFGSTALQAAVWFSKAQSVTELLRLGADVNARNSYQITPLHDCAQKGTAEIALILLEHGADVTARNHAGQTPLEVAVENDHSDIAEVLRQHGAKE